MVLKALGFVVFFALTAVALGTVDPELQTCRHQCRVQMGFDLQQRQACLEKCEKYIREKQGRQQEEQHGGSSGGHGGEERRQGEDNPYVFQPRHFRAEHKSQQGKFSVLPRFTDRSSDLFEGIENFRVGFLEVEPKTFVAPSHPDADVVGFVVDGSGTVNIIQNNKRKSYDVRIGSIVFIPAGATWYLVNTDNNNKLVIIKLMQTISTTPGLFEFFSGTGRNSFLNAFHSSILEAAYDESKETIDRVLQGREDSSPFIQVSDEQLKSLSKGDTIWPFKTDKSSSQTEDIFKHKSVSNNYGQLFEIDNDDLKELGDIEVAFANITRGGMLGPLFNTRATQLAFVVAGNGWAQMASSKVSSQSGLSEEGAIPRYETLNAELRRCTLLVIPPGHPYVHIASQDDLLQIVIFNINAKNNERVALAGKNNLYSNLDDVAKEVSFGVSSKLVDQVFENDDDLELFSKGPEWQQQRGDRADQ